MRGPMVLGVIELVVADLKKGLERWTHIGGKQAPTLRKVPASQVIGLQLHTWARLENTLLKLQDVPELVSEDCWNRESGPIPAHLPRKQVHAEDHGAILPSLSREEQLWGGKRVGCSTIIHEAAGRRDAKQVDKDQALSLPDEIDLPISSPGK